MNQTNAIPHPQLLKIPILSPRIDVRALWLDEYDGGSTKTSLRYLQWLRSAEVSLSPGQLDAGRKAYYEDLDKRRMCLKDALQPLTWDLLVESPSSKPHAKEFADVSRSTRKTEEVVFHKAKNGSATKGASIDELVISFSYAPDLDFAKFTSVLIVDDVLAEGSTAAAIILKLQQAGLKPDAGITLAVALRVLSQERRPRLGMEAIKALMK